MNRTFLAAPVLLALIAGCATHNPDVVQGYQAERQATVIDATVLSVRPVHIDGRQGGGAPLAGAVVGGVAGSSIGSGRGSVVGGVLGVVAGAVVGNAIERQATSEDGVELLVQLRNGERRAIVQALGQERFNPGDPVMLVVSGGRTRVQLAPVASYPPRT